MVRLESAWLNRLFFSNSIQIRSGTNDLAKSLSHDRNGIKDIDRNLE